MGYSWKDFVKIAQVTPRPIVKGEIHWPANGNRGVAVSASPKTRSQQARNTGKPHATGESAKAHRISAIVKDKLHVPETSTQSAGQSSTPGSGFQRVGGSRGASSSGWDPNYKPPTPGGRPIFKCNRCGQQYGDAKDEWSDRAKASWRNEIKTAILQHLRMCENSMEHNGNPPKETVRKAFNVPKEEIEKMSKIPWLEVMKAFEERNSRLKPR